MEDNFLCDAAVIPDENTVAAADKLGWKMTPQMFKKMNKMMEDEKYMRIIYHDQQRRNFYQRKMRNGK